MENTLVDKDNTEVAIEISLVDLEKRLDEVSFLQVLGESQVQGESQIQEESQA